LPRHGPGRAVNGNFALDEFRVTASARNGNGEAVCVKLCHPSASFSQHTYGGWPITAALDGDPKTGWSIDPLEGEPHVAVFEAQQPVGFPGGTTLQFVLRQGVPADHNLGRLRLSATTAKPPLPSPPPRRLRSLVVKGRMPASESGGLLVISVEMTRDSQPMHVRGPGKYFAAEGKLAGQDVSWESVVGKQTYPCCWQAWRLPVASSVESQPFELTIKADFAPDVSLCPKGHFVPYTDTAVSGSTTVR